MGKHKVFNKPQNYFSFCIIMSVGLVIMSVICYALVDKNAKNTIDNNLSYFTQQSFYLIEERLALVEQMMIEVSSNEQIKKWLALDKKDFDVMERANMVSEISKLTTGANHIRSIFIYNKEENYVITESGYSNDVDVFLEYILEVQQIKRTEMKEILSEINDMVVMKYDKIFTNSSFLVLAPIYDTELKQNCVIGVVVEARFLEYILERVKISSNCILLITNEYGEIISASNQELLKIDIFKEGNETLFCWDSVRYSIYCSTSDKYRIKYYNFIPDNTVTDGVVAVRGVLISLIIISCILLLILRGLFSKKNYKILNAFISGIRNINPDIEGEEVGYINSAIDGLCLEEKRINKLIREHYNVLQEVIARRLINGDDVEEDKISNLVNYLNLDIKTGYKRVAVFLFDSENKGAADGFVADINQCFSNGVLYVKEDNIVIVIFINRLINFEDINIDGKTRFKYIRRVGVGTPCMQSYEIKNSYTEAMEAAKYVAFKREECIINYEQIPQNTDKKEKIEWDFNSFIDLIKNGKASEAVNLLEEKIEDEFQKSRYVKEDYLKNLFFELANNVKNAFDLPESIDMIENKDFSLTSFYDLEKVIEEYLIWAGEVWNNKKMGADENNRVIEYIRAQNGFDFDLNQIAVDLDVNPSYLSRWFKNCIGENYTDYIKRLKIAEVKRLLTESELSLKEIAIRVNYSSDSALAKAFKKETGITPKTFREISRIKNEE